MLSSDETDYDTSGSLIRASRTASRRELLRSKQRARNTEMLPGVNEEDTRGKIPRPQITYLREENSHLRRELEELQEQLATYQSSMDLLDGEIETIHRDHRQELEQYQQHLREMMEERNQMQETNQQLERRYQDLYQSFQDAVEDEANKMVKEATQTLILSPGHAPALLSDVAKTFEAQVKQTEALQTTELLALMRQAQYKAELLEQEMVGERSELANEREHLRQLRESLSQQAQQRFRIEQTRLRTRWTSGLMFTSLVILGVMVALEIVFYSFNKVALFIDIFLPLAICMVLTYVIAHMHTSGRLHLHTSGRLHVQVKKPSVKTGGAGVSTKKAVAKR